MHTQYYQQLLETLRRIPGVTAAGAVDNVPLGGSLSFAGFLVDGKSTGVGIERYLPGYFQAIGLPVLQGELPTEADEASGRNLVTISTDAARALFPDGSAVGRQMFFKISLRSRRGKSPPWSRTSVTSERSSTHRRRSTSRSARHRR